MTDPEYRRACQIEDFVNSDYIDPSKFLITVQECRLLMEKLRKDRMDMAIAMAEGWDG